MNSPNYQEMVKWASQAGQGGLLLILGITLALLHETIEKIKEHTITTTESLIERASLAFKIDMSKRLLEFVTVRLADDYGVQREATSLLVMPDDRWLEWWRKFIESLDTEEIGQFIVDSRVMNGEELDEKWLPNGHWSDKDESCTGRLAQDGFGQLGKELRKWELN